MLGPNLYYSSWQKQRLNRNFIRMIAAKIKNKTHADSKFCRKLKILASAFFADCAGFSAALSALGR